MFTLLAGLWRYLFSKDEYCILLLGLDNAGKTTFLEQVKRKFLQQYPGYPFERIIPTVGQNVCKVTVESKRLVIWDLGGQDELQALWDKYFLECHAVVYVVDSEDIERVPKSAEVFGKHIHKAELQNVPVCVLANKTDLMDLMPLADIQSQFAAYAESRESRPIKFIATSAVNGLGIEEVTTWLVSAVTSNTLRPPRNAY